jgi:hypothetical protein
MVAKLSYSEIRQVANSRAVSEDHRWVGDVGSSESVGLRFWLS